MQNKKTLGERIAYYRKENNMQTTTLSRELGISRTTLYQWEHDKVIPKLDDIIKIANALSISVYKLIPLSLESTEVDQENDAYGITITQNNEISFSIMNIILDLMKLEPIEREHFYYVLCKNLYHKEKILLAKIILNSLDTE